MALGPKTKYLTEGRRKFFLVIKNYKGLSKLKAMGDTGSNLENLNGRCHLKNLGIDERPILKLILK